MILFCIVCSKGSLPIDRTDPNGQLCQTGICPVGQQLLLMLGSVRDATLAFVCVELHEIPVNVFLQPVRGPS